MPTTRFSGAGLAGGDDLGEDAPAIHELGEYQAEAQSRIPSVLERIRTLVDPNNVDPTRLSNLDAQETLAFCVHHDINADQAAQLTARGSHRVEAKRGLWQNILLNLRNYEEGDPESPRKGRIPIAEIHVPAVAGCECTYTQDSSASAKVGLTVKICGVGGGGGQEAKVTFSHAVTSPACGQVTIPGTYQVTPWTNPDYGSRIDLVSFVDFLPDSVGLRAIPAEREHPCSPGVSAQLAKLSRKAGDVFETHPLGIPGGVLTPSQRVETTRELTLTLDGIIEMKSQFTKGFAYAWKILGPAEYLRFFESGRSHVHFWCWDC
jgi:hypothetical protein